MDTEMRLRHGNRNARLQCLHRRDWATSLAPIDFQQRLVWLITFCLSSRIHDPKKRHEARHSKEPSTKATPHPPFKQQVSKHQNLPTLPVLAPVFFHLHKNGSCRHLSGIEIPYQHPGPCRGMEQRWRKTAHYTLQARRRRISRYSVGGALIVPLQLSVLLFRATHHERIETIEAPIEI